MLLVALIVIKNMKLFFCDVKVYLIKAWNLLSRVDLDV